MAIYESPLDDLRVASPCSADWNRMDGDERKRFCAQCRLNVYNLSSMTRYDAENLLRLSEGRLCVRYYQRADGTILTQDCPVGWGRVKQRTSLVVATVFSLIASLFGAAFLVSTFGRRTVVGSIDFARPTPTPRYEAIMGNIAIPTPTPERSRSNSAKDSADRETS